MGLNSNGHSVTGRYAPAPLILNENAVRAHPDVQLNTSVFSAQVCSCNHRQISVSEGLLPMLCDALTQIS